jgi:hypothetical protein
MMYITTIGLLTKALMEMLIPLFITTIVSILKTARVPGGKLIFRVYITYVKLISPTGRTAAVCT